MEDSQNYNQLRTLIDSAKTLLGIISIDYNSQVGPNITQLIGISKQIIPLIEPEYPSISENLKTALSKISYLQPGVFTSGYGFVNAFCFGDIRTTIKYLDILYPVRIEKRGRKVFVSHSSRDTVVNDFVEKILMLGCGFKRTDIFCTMDHTAIRTGDDFRDEIVRNMKDCDFILFLISKNYRKSEVCHNEMGAAWALEGKRVLPMKFPNLDFSKIGFLNVVKQAADITDKTKLDELYQEICSYYGFQPDWVNYNRQKESFVDLLK